MIRIQYFADPDKVIQDHVGNYFDMIEFSYRDFSSQKEALVFLEECTRPFTKIQDIINSIDDETFETPSFKKSIKENLYTLIDKYNNEN